MPASPEFERDYAAALHDYLRTNSEAALETAYELGRRAVGNGVGLLQVAELHEQIVADQLAQDPARIVALGARFLLESLSPFEMTHRGFREANIALRNLNDTLEQRVADRTADAEAARSQAEAANRAKSDFLAVMSHELRTPLNAVLGYADLLQAEISGPLTDLQKTHVNAIKASARHLLQLIEEILAFARIETGREEINLQITDLATLMEEAAALITPIAGQKNVEFRLSLPPLNTRLCTDPQKLRQIMVNLLSNAVKFTEKGHVAFSTQVTPEWIEIVVEDSGIGIPQQHLENVFESFWQVESTTTRRTGGTGIGLSVSRNLARALGGDITVASSEGQGSTFTIRHPTALDPCGGDNEPVPHPPPDRP